MYVGDDVSPDFYGWVFPKYDHVGVGTGTVVNRPAIKDYQVWQMLESDIKTLSTTALGLRRPPTELARTLIVQWSPNANSYRTIRRFKFSDVKILVASSFRLMFASLCFPLMCAGRNPEARG